MSEKLPTALPLPEVPEYTDDVVFGHLGLPVGFDEERLLVNLRGIERISKVAGLGGVSISAVTGEAGQTHYDNIGMTPSGAALFGGRMHRDKEPLSTGVVRFPTTSTFFDKPRVSIEVNKSEAEERIREAGDKYDRGLFDVDARAKYLNNAIKDGLRAASIDANIDGTKLRQALRYYGFYSGLGVVVGANPVRMTELILGMGPVIMNLDVARETSITHIIKKTEHSSIAEMLKRYRQSLFVGPALDRAMIATGLVRATKLIRARN